MIAHRQKTSMVCTHPFEWFEVHEDGSVFLCCPAWLKTPIGNILENDVSAIWNSGAAQAIRKRIFDGSFGRCNKKRCPRLKLNIPPVTTLSQIDDTDISAAIREGKTNLPYDPKRVNFCFDARCNLTCPSCRSSHRTYSEEESKRAETISTRLVKDIAPSVEEITIAGHGDPFGSPLYRSFLFNYEPQQFPKLKRVRLHTNGLLLNQENWQRMATIAPLVSEIEVSIDAATAATYSLNRGGDWKQLCDNLSYMASLSIPLTFSFVVQQNNYCEMPAFIDLATDKNAAVYFSQFVNWGTFTKEEFLTRAIHLPAHPEHQSFRAIVESLSDMTNVDTGNLL